MAIDLQKIQVKFYLADDAVLSPEDAFRLFNRWIPETPDEVLIDVAGYDHVPRGPKTVLVGHAANYVLDDSDGRPGLVYAHKRRVDGDNAGRLRAAFAAAVRACRRLETAADATATPRFCGGEALVVVNDRLRAPSTDATLKAIRGDLDRVLGEVYGGAPTRIERLGDARQRFAVRVRAEGNPAVADLAARLAR